MRQVSPLTPLGTRDCSQSSTVPAMPRSSGDETLIAPMKTLRIAIVED
jgi:hypothetical protein